MKMTVLFAKGRGMLNSGLLVESLRLCICVAISF